MKSVEFRHCPFCGGNRMQFNVRTMRNTGTDFDGTVFHYIECLECDCRTGGYTDRDATECYGYTGENAGKQCALNAWNNRSNKNDL